MIKVTSYVAEVVPQPIKFRDERDRISTYYDFYVGSLNNRQQRRGTSSV